MKVDKFKPEIYFSHTDYSEITMAKAIYYENKKKKLVKNVFIFIAMFIQ